MVIQSHRLLVYYFLSRYVDISSVQNGEVAYVSTTAISMLFQGLSVDIEIIKLQFMLCFSAKKVGFSSYTFVINDTLILKYL